VYRFVDLTKARPGTELGVFERWRERYLDGSDAVELCVLADQVGLFSPPPDAVPLPIVTVIPDATAADDAAIAKWALKRLTDLVEREPKVTVSTFRPSVTAVTAALKGTSSGIGNVPFPAETPTSNATGAPDPWPSDFMPADDAMRHMVVALRNSKKPVRFTTLRPLLVAQSPDMAPTAGGFASRPRFVTRLVSEAMQRGLVRTHPDGNDDSNPFIELRAGAALPEIAASPDPTDSRSSHLITTLRAGRLGPFQEVRWEAYEQMDQLLLATPSKSASDLLRDAVAAVREADEDSRLDRGAKPFPWSRFRQFLIMLMNRRPVLLSDGVRVKHSWSDAHMVVDGFIDDWKLALDGELILFLMQSGVRIDMNDLSDLAGALYNSRREECFDRVIAVIRHLVSAGLVTESTTNQGELALIDQP